MIFGPQLISLPDGTTYSLLSTLGIFKSSIKDQPVRHRANVTVAVSPVGNGTRPPLCGDLLLAERGRCPQLGMGCRPEGAPQLEVGCLDE